MRGDSLIAAPGTTLATLDIDGPPSKQQPGSGSGSGPSRLLATVGVLSLLNIGLAVATGVGWSRALSPSSSPPAVPEPLVPCVFEHPAQDLLIVPAPQCEMRAAADCFPPAGLPLGGTTCEEALGLLSLGISSGTTIDCDNQHLDPNPLSGCPGGTYPAANASSGFWPAECGCGPVSGDGTPLPPRVSNSGCGCVVSETELAPGFNLSTPHLGCASGPNNVSSIFEALPWCFLRDATTCPASFPSSTPGEPAMRQCGGDPPAADPNAGANAFYDDCTGNCSFVSTRSVVSAHFKPEARAAFAQPSARLNGLSLLDYMEAHSVA
jgi:hypothetical protein